MPSTHVIADELSKATFEKTGYITKWVKKEHYNFMKGVRRAAEIKTSTQQTDPALLEDGNCLLFALASLTGKVETLVAFSQTVAMDPTKTKKVKSLEDFDKTGKHFMHPSQDLPKTPGSYIMAVWRGEKMHAAPLVITLSLICITAVPSATGTTIDDLSLPLLAFKTTFMSGVDRKKVVFFELSGRPMSPTSPLHCFLELQVGGQMFVASVHAIPLSL